MKTVHLLLFAALSACSLSPASPCLSGNHLLCRASVRIRYEFQDNFSQKFYGENSKSGSSDDGFLLGRFQVGFDYRPYENIRLCLRKLRILLSSMILLLVSHSHPLHADAVRGRTELSIFAAAGAKPAMDEIRQKFESQSDIKVKINYAGGGEALSQMTLSKSGDLYVAPEQKFMESAKEKQVIDPQTIRILAYVIPVIAVRKGNPKKIFTLADLTQPGIRVAIARPETTLTGKYALEIFEKAGLAEAIEKNFTTEASRPDHLLTMLILDQVDAGIIWHTYQTQAPDKIEIIYLSPQQLTGVGKMQIAVSLFSKNRASGQAFIEFATSDQGKAIFRNQGYLVDAEEVRQYYPEI